LKLESGSAKVSSLLGYLSCKHCISTINNYYSFILLFKTGLIGIEFKCRKMCGLESWESILRLVAMTCEITLQFHVFNRNKGLRFRFSPAEHPRHSTKIRQPGPNAENWRWTTSANTNTIAKTRVRCEIMCILVFVTKVNQSHWLDI